MFDLQYKKIHLPNGLTAVFIPRTTAYSVSVYVGIKAGSFYEDATNNGVAHFLEHLLFEGTEKLKSSKEVINYIESVGGQYGAWTDKDYVTFFAKVTPSYLNRAIHFLAEILLHTNIDQQSIDKEKKIIKEEKHKSNNNFEGRAWEDWTEWIWGKDTVWGRSILGSENDINLMTKDKLIKFLNCFYNPSSMVIVITGNFTVESAEAYIIENFGSKAIGEISHVIPPPRIKSKNHLKINKTSSLQDYLIVGVITGVSYSNEDKFKVELLANILGSGASSRVVHKLIYKLGIAYEVRVSNWFLSDTGVLYIFGGFAQENMLLAVETIFSEFNKLKIENISESELSQTKEKMIADLCFLLEDPSMQAYHYMQQMITENKILEPKQTIERINAITTADVQETAKKYFSSDNIYTLVGGRVSLSVGDQLRSYIRKEVI